MTRLARRLPGIRFEIKAPTLTEVLPRMDIAAFVGLAASGPLHTPVAVEDAVTFEAIFGSDAPLALDTVRGEMAYAYLGPAVRAFFDNGGRRAWIVRVAAPTAIANRFAIPGLLQADFDLNGQPAGFQPAFATARSAGSWSDSFQVSANILSQRLKLVSLNLGDSLVEAEMSFPQPLAAGDLLRFSFNKENASLLLSLDSVKPLADKRFKVSGNLRAWFVPLTPEDVGPDGAELQVFNFQPGQVGPQRLDLMAPPRFEAAAVRLTLTIRGTLSTAPALSTLLALNLEAGGKGWLKVEAVRSAGIDGAVEISGAAARWLPDGPVQKVMTVPENLSAERLSFELWTRQGETGLSRLSDLTFDARHERFWGGLPSDEQLYDPDNSTRANPYNDLWLDAANPRFNLAGSSGRTFFPLFMEALPRYFNERAPSDGTSLERDGLAEFSSALFLDPDLAEVGAADLITQADFLRYQGPAPRKLSGLHSLLAIEEITLLALPDAVQPGWTEFEPPQAIPPDPSPGLDHPDWRRCSNSDAAGPENLEPAAIMPDYSNFLDCGILVLASPGNLRNSAPDPTGSFKLEWDRVAFNGAGGNEVEYLLEEATRPDWSDAYTLSRGKTLEYNIFGRRSGAFYYRVRAIKALATGEWSNGLLVQVRPENQWQLRSPRDFQPAALFEIQQAALRLCAARGDMLAVLALPQHYLERASLDYLGSLRSGSGQPGLTVSPGPTTILSYGAVYHPWLTFRYNGVLQNSPPDGLACGILAKRAVERGAWVAPANEILPGIVALTPLFREEYRLELQEARLNLVRQEPRGFTVLNADTLSLDEDLRQISVRRLLILLRRLALKLGATYVFEPNDSALDRLVQGGFEALLEKLFARGAFAGATPASAFQVVTTTLNSSQMRDQGRFMVEIRVAPALPLTFLTVRLVQADDRGVFTEVI